MVEIGESYLKIAETGSGRNKNRIVRLVKKTLSAKEDAAISEEVKNIFSSLKITGRKIRLVIPRHLVTVRFLRIPSVDDEEIGKIIKIEALKYVPYSDEEVVAGYRVVEKSEDGYSNILLAIAQAGMVERLVNILKSSQAGEVASVWLGSEALFSWYRSTSPSEERNCLIANIDKDYADVVVAQGDKLTFTRGFLYDASGASAADDITKQLHMSLVTYQKESGKRIDKIVLTGSDFIMAECKAAASKGFDIPVEVIDQMQGGALSDTAGCDTEGASFAELLGMSARPQGMRVDLMPESVRGADKAVSLRSSLAVNGILIAIMALVLFAFVVKRLHDKSVSLSGIDGRLKAIASEVSKVRKMADDINIVTSQMDKKPLAVDVVREVYRVTPSAVLLSMLDFERQEALTTRGSAPALNDVIGYVNALENSLYFESVKVKYVTKRVAAGKETVDFEISCNLTKQK